MHTENKAYWQISAQKKLLELVKLVLPISSFNYHIVADTGSEKTWLSSFRAVCLKYKLLVWIEASAWPFVPLWMIGHILRWLLNADKEPRMANLLKSRMSMLCTTFSSLQSCGWWLFILCIPHFCSCAVPCLVKLIRKVSADHESYRLCLISFTRLDHT